MYQLCVCRNAGSRALYTRTLVGTSDTHYQLSFIAICQSVDYPKLLYFMYVSPSSSSTCRLLCCANESVVSRFKFLIFLQKHSKITSRKHAQNRPSKFNSFELFLSFLMIKCSAFRDSRSTLYSINKSSQAVLQESSSALSHGLFLTRKCCDILNSPAMRPVVLP